MLHMVCKNFHLHISMAPFKSQLIHFSSITAPHTKHETFLNQKLDLVEDSLRLVSILIRTFFAAKRPRIETNLKVFHKNGMWNVGY